MTNGSYRSTLARKGLQPFLWTQFLGAFNDNLFKFVVSMLAVHMASGATGGRDLALVGAVFIAPFLLFAIQLLVFTTVSAALLIGLLRETSGLKPTSLGPLSREWIIGAAVSAAALALLVATVGAQSPFPTTGMPDQQSCCGRRPRW